MKRTRILAFYLGCLVLLPAVQAITWLFSWSAIHPFALTWLAFWSVAALIPTTFFAGGIFFSGLSGLPGLERVAWPLPFLAGAAYTLMVLFWFAVAPGLPKAWLILGAPVFIYFVLTCNPLTACLPGYEPAPAGVWIAGLIAAGCLFPIFYFAVALFGGFPAYFLLSWLAPHLGGGEILQLWLIFASFPAGGFALLSTLSPRSEFHQKQMALYE